MYDDNNVVHGGWVVGDMTVKRGNMTEEDVRRPEVTRGGGIVAVVGYCRGRRRWRKPLNW